MKLLTERASAAVYGKRKGRTNMTKQEYIKEIVRSLDKIDDLDKLACTWLYVDVLAAEREEQE